MLGVGRGHPEMDRARDDITGREVGERMHVGHERNAVEVAEHRTLTA